MHLKFFFKIFLLIAIFAVVSCRPNDDVGSSLPAGSNNTGYPRYYQGGGYQQPYYPQQQYYQQPQQQYYQQPQYGAPYYNNVTPGSRFYSNPYAIPPTSQYPQYDADQYYVPPTYYQNIEPTNYRKEPFLELKN